MLRAHYLSKIEQYFASHKIVALLGPRQSGKTTTAMQYRDECSLAEVHYFDCEDPRTEVQFENPMSVLEPLKGLIIIDEIQLLPKLFQVLRVLADQEQVDRHFLILGSSSPHLLQRTSESLAGRVAFIELMPFNIFEIGDWQRLWLRGGYPRSYLATDYAGSQTWREFYIQNFLERDIPMLGIKIPALALRRFWTMVAHCHANILNQSQLARSMGKSNMAIRHYIDILSGTFMLRQLQPFHANIKKRQVKHPKIYLRDSGILHSLLNISSWQNLQSVPYLGASWEGFALDSIIHYHQALPHNCYFWSTHAGAECDLLIETSSGLLAYEFKYTDAPKLTKSMLICLSELPIEKITVIYPGTRRYSLHDEIEVVGLAEYCGL